MSAPAEPEPDSPVGGSPWGALAALMTRSWLTGGWWLGTADGPYEHSAHRGAVRKGRAGVVCARGRTRGCLRAEYAASHGTDPGLPWGAPRVRAAAGRLGADPWVRPPRV